MTESTFSLAQIWAQGDGVSHAVAIMLALMSLASWSVIFVKAWSLVQLRRMSGGAKQFWHATSFEAGMAALAPAGDNPFRDLAERGMLRFCTSPALALLHHLVTAEGGASMSWQPAWRWAPAGFSPSTSARCRCRSRARCW